MPALTSCKKCNVSCHVKPDNLCFRCRQESIKVPKRTTCKKCGNSCNKSGDGLCSFCRNSSRTISKV